MQLAEETSLQESKRLLTSFQKPGRQTKRRERTEAWKGGEGQVTDGETRQEGFGFSLCKKCKLPIWELDWLINLRPPPPFDILTESAALVLRLFRVKCPLRGLSCSVTVTGIPGCWDYSIYNPTPNQNETWPNPWNRGPLPVRVRGQVHC